jgi:hypothetical protein
MDRTVKDALRQRVAIAASAVMSNTPSHIAEELTGLVEAVGPTRIRAAEIVLLVELFAQQLLATPLPRPEEFDLDELSEDDEDDLVRTAWVLRALVEDGARQDGPEVTCLLGPTLLAMATHFTGRTSHVRPEALGASKATVDAAMEVLGWSVSANPAERLVAALTATDARLVTPLLDDPTSSCVLRLRCTAPRRRATGAASRTGTSIPPWTRSSARAGSPPPSSSSARCSTQGSRCRRSHAASPSTAGSRRSTRGTSPASRSPTRSPTTRSTGRCRRCSVRWPTSSRSAMPATASTATGSTCASRSARWRCSCRWPGVAPTAERTTRSAGRRSSLVSTS